MQIRVIPIRRGVTSGAIGGSGRCMLLSMKKTLSPIESEFATTDEAEAYHRWFCAKIQASLADSRQGVAHDRVMAEIDAVIEAAESGLNAKRS